MVIGDQTIDKKNYLFADNGAMVTGWKKTGSDASATWSYYEGSGAMAVSKWVLVGGAWYYMDADGVMQTGQFSDGKASYYANASGSMVTGWVNTGTANAPTWYYYGPSGAMVTNAWAGDYWLGADGKMVTNSWVDDDKYYVGADGKWDSSKKPAASSDSKDE